MKERGVSQRVQRIIAIELNKPALIESLNLVSGLSSDKSNIGNLVKTQKMAKYKELISQLNPVAKQFETLKRHHTDLVNILQQLNTEVESCIDKTTNAIKLGRNINTEMNLIKSRRVVLDSVLRKVGLSEDGEDNTDSGIYSESVLSVVNKLTQRDRG